MHILERYNAELDKLSEQERNLAAQAKERGDEREHSIHLMCASMLGEMLKVLGRNHHNRVRPNHIPDIIAHLEREEEQQKKSGDFDSADRTHIKVQTIRQALHILERLENENA